MPWAVVGAVAGAAISADAAGDAADQQTDAAASGERLSRDQFEQVRSDQRPYREAGYGALNRLQILLGLTPQGASGGASRQPSQTRENFDSAAYLRANPDVAAVGLEPYGHYLRYGRGEGRQFTFTPQSIEASAAANAQNDSDIAAARASGDFGMLARRFTGADLENEPGYQFEMGEGNRAIQRSATANGRNLSGATLRALQRYGQGVASTRFGEAFNRNQVFTNSLFNRLSGISGTGQTATDQVGQAGERFANAAGAYGVGAANVGAARRVAQGNTWAGAINQGISAWQRRPTASPSSGFFRADDPYRTPGYFGGEEGE